MRYIWSSLLLLLISFQTFSQPKLSEHAKISLLTCSPGDELYSIFGHSAIRVSDPVIGIDDVYNYGTFNFDTPNFYLKFANGRLNYMLAKGRFSRFKQIYWYEQRSVYEQTLNLTGKEKQQLFDALLTNLKPENKFYRYDFFFDNCATRIRDIIAANVDGKIVWPDSKNKDLTFRDQLHEYDGDSPWIADGLDIILGVKTDYKANVSEQMYIPDYMQLYFENAQIEGQETRRNLVEKGKQILQFQPEKSTTFWSPLVVFGALLILFILLSIWETESARTFFYTTRVLLFASGVVGLIIVFLWFISMHAATKINLNIIWANPLNVIIAFLPLRWYAKKAIRWYVNFYGGSLVLLLVAGWFLPQFFPPLVWPVTLLILLRIALLIKNRE
jgi:hypothetical protein